MATEAPRSPKEEAQAVKRLGAVRRVLIVLACVVAALLVVAGVGLLWINSDSGRKFAAQQIGALEFENGLRIEVGAIEGSLTGAMRARDLALRDPKGVFFRAPLVDLDWRP